MVAADGGMIAVSLAGNSLDLEGEVPKPMKVEVCGAQYWTLDPVKAIIFAAIVDAMARESLRRWGAGK
nr:hypothetical protein [uncultured Albidiferax sp.]